MGITIDRRFAAFAAVVWGLGVLASHGAAGAEVHKRALLVGVSNYTQNRPLEQSFHDLHGAQDVARLAAKLGEERYGFEVESLTDGQATRQAVLAAFDTFLIAPAKPGDICLFYFSGHGQRLRDQDPPDPHADEISGQDSSLVPFDYAGKSASGNAQSNIRDDDIGDRVNALAAKINRDGQRGSVVLVFDACHSGTAARGDLVPRGRSWDEQLDGPRPATRPAGFAPPKDSTGMLSRGEASRVGYVSLGACRDDQEAFERDGSGLLSGALLAALDQAQPTTTWRQLLETVTVRVQAAYPAQMPVLEGDADQRVFQGEFGRRADYHVLSLDQGKLTAPVGRLHGMTRGSKFQVFAPGGDVTDLKALVAEATVVEVEDIRSRLQLTEPYRGKVDLAGLDGGRAVETVHQPGDRPLRVWLNGVKLDPALLREFPVVKTAGIGRGDCDVELRAEKGVLQLVLSSAGPARPVGPLPLGAQDAERLKEALLGLWRVRFVLGLAADQRQQGLALAQMRVVPLVTERDQHGNPIGRFAGRQELPEEGAQLVLPIGSGFNLEFHNTGAKYRVFVTVLQVSPNGDLDVLFPLANVAQEEVDTKRFWVPATDRRYGTIPWLMSARREGEEERYTLDPAGLGTNQLILLATTEPTDFSWMQFSLEELLRRDSSKGDMSPLEQLMLYAKTGSRRGSAAALPRDAEWSISATTCLVTPDH